MAWESSDFADRQAAGRELGEALAAQELPEPRLVLALPRGGVPVAAEVARRLGAPLDLLMVRKIPAPGEPELALGAVAEGVPPVVVLDPELAAMMGASSSYLETALEQALAEIDRRRRVYGADTSAVEVRGRTVIVVDDGLATGATARAAGQAVRKLGAARIILAVPVAPAAALDAVGEAFDQTLCLRSPRSFGGVGEWYREFHQLSDAEVRQLLTAARAQASDPDGGRAG